ncbi:MAG TPA: polysaccharide deacetylase family protein [Tepidisphaeraceae bacterium]
MRSAIVRFDQALSRAHLAVAGERPALLTFLFHGLFRNDQEVATQAIDPQQCITVDAFTRFVAHFAAHGYRFVCERDILEGLDPLQRHVLITFDDGYFSHMLALEALEKYQAPTTIFVSTNHVRQQKCFWWDVFHREMQAAGVSRAQAAAEMTELKMKTSEEVEQILRDRFGDSAFIPRGDIDRPLTPGELRSLSEHRLISLGNHTANHAILTNYSAEAALGQIQECQQAMLEMTGRLPVSIAYPNGRYSNSVIASALLAGLRLGITVDARKNRLPLAGRDAMTLGRFVLDGTRDIDRQCGAYRSDLQLRARLSQRRSGYR